MKLKQTLTGLVAAMGLASTMHSQPSEPEGKGPRVFPDALITTAQAFSEAIKEIRKQHVAFAAPEAKGDSGPALNLRYQLTVDCLNRLPGLDSKKRLEQSGISTRVAIQSLKPTQPGGTANYNDRLPALMEPAQPLP